MNVQKHIKNSIGKTMVKRKLLYIDLQLNDMHIAHTSSLDTSIRIIVYFYVIQ